MSDQNDLPPGFPGGHVPIIGEVVGDGEVQFSGGGNRMFRAEEVEAAFGRHPMADWKPVIKKRKRSARRR